MVAYRKDPPPDELKNRVYYEDGQLYWMESERAGANKRTDKPIGYACKKTGYRRTNIRVGGKSRGFTLHRLIYWVVTGEWVPMIDHINGDRLDNRIENLRPATVRENSCNKKASGTIPLIGVQEHYSGYRLAIRIEGKQYWIAGYKTPEAAGLARDILARLFHGDFAKYNCLDNSNLTVNGVAI
ncbi:HNH endonuclease [Escherichia coli]|nr:HNH endonuclease [Escherichia coli]